MTSPSSDNATNEQQALATALHATWFGASLDPGTIGRLAGLARLRTAKTGEVLLVEGGRSDEFGIVVSGRLALRMLVPERGMVTILTVEPGDLYGWSAIAAPQRATSTVVAIEPSELIAFDGMDLRLALAEDDRLAAALYPRVLEAVSRRLSATRLQLLDLFTAPRGGCMVSATAPTIDPTEPIGFLPRPELDRLIEALQGDGRRVIGPTIADGAVVYDEIATQADLPAGWRADQAPGRYRLDHRGGPRLFDYVDRSDRLEAVHLPAPRPDHGRPSRRRRRDVHRRRAPGHAARLPRRPRLRAGGARDPGHGPLAGPAVDADYAARRSEVLIVAVECVTAASTCFCTSMGTGPEVRSGFDLALTELDDGFVVRVGSAAGSDLAARLPLAPVEPERRAEATAAVAATRRSIGDPVDTDGLPARLLANLDNPHWAEIAERCLACANCTLVCPTCFCTSVGQRSDLDGQESVVRAGLGQLLHRRLRQGRRRQLPAAHAGPLPPVADPQVRDVVGPVRDLRLRRLRPLRDLVPGRDRRPRRALRDRRLAVGRPRRRGRGPSRTQPDAGRRAGRPGDAARSARPCHGTGRPRRPGDAARPRPLVHRSGPLDATRIARHDDPRPR